MIRGAIRLPHTVIVATVLAVLFGVLAAKRVPLQMRPSVDKPEITVTTLYPGASPEEVEDKITRPIEEELNTVEGVRRLTSSSSQGRSQITLEFDLHVNRDAALVDVLNKLGQVRRLPEEAEAPVAEAISSDTTTPIMWMGFQGTNDRATRQTNRMRTLVDDMLEPRLRRVEGVGSLIIAGGQEREVRVTVDLHRLADRKIPLSNLVRAIQQTHLTVRGGPIESGKREYVVWTTGRAKTLKALGEIVLARSARGVVRLRDIARVEASFKRRQTIMRLNGKGAIAMGVLRKSGANVPATARRIAKVKDEINRELKQRGLPFKLRILYTEVKYIDRSLALVTNNLLLGGVFAVLVLLLFLGSIRSVVVIAISIPVSIVTVFIVLDALGRSMNIVSLAGLAFAVGMVVDNAIVVLENIHRHLSESGQTNQSAEESAYRGTREVALAIAASTATTVSVFVPIAFLKSEAGQIFQDIAIAIAFAVAFSLLVSLTLIPMLSRLLLRPPRPPASWNPMRYLRGVGAAVHRAYDWLLARILARGAGPLRLAICVFVAAFFVYSLSLLPPADYLPSGNRNLIITLAKPLPGTNVEKISEAARPLERFLLRQKETQRIFTVFSPRFSAIGVIIKDEYANEETVNRFLGMVRGQAGGIAGFRYLFPIKASIFRVPGKQFEAEIAGPGLERLSAVARVLQGRLRAVPGVVGVRSDYEEGALNLHVSPDKSALTDQGMTSAQLAEAVQVALGGLRVGYFLDRGREIDLTLIGTGASSVLGAPPATRLSGAPGVRAIPLIGGKGRLIYLDALSTIRTERGPTSIQRLEMQRAVTLTVNVDRDTSLGEAMERVERSVLNPLRAALPSTYTVGLGDTADRLNETLDELVSSFLLALLISYLLMVALFRSFTYPLIIAATVPMAATGAFLFVGLAEVSFDTITMLGLIILAGIVVNNAILIVHQTLSLRRAGASFDAALHEGATSRLRPILMTAITSVLGMLPLALGTGPGAELYRGLGIAIVGGLTVSTLVTLFLVPALMGLTQDFRRHLLGKRS